MRNSLHCILLGRVASGINGLLGAWIMLAPLVTGDLPHHGGSGVWATLTLGGVVMAFGMIRSIAPEELAALSWLNLVLGGFLLASPWLLRFAADEERMWTAVALGGTIMLLAALSARVTVLLRQRLSRAFPCSARISSAGPH